MDNIAYSPQIPDPVLLMELKKLGLTSNEATIYLIVMAMHKITASSLAHHARISRPTTYRILDHLTQKNLVNKIKQHRKTFFVATPPHALLSLLKIKQREVEEQEREFLRIISILQNTYLSSSGSGTVSSYNHRGNIKLLREDVIATAHKGLFVFFHHDLPQNIFTEIRMTYQKIHKQSPRSIVREIVPQDFAHYTRTTLPNVHSRYHVGPHQKSAITILVTDCVFLIDAENSTTIHNQQITNAFSALLQELWHNL